MRHETLGAKARPTARWGRELVRNESGQTLILITLAMFVFLGIAALAIDFAQLSVAHHQAQVAADAAALSAAQDMETTTTIEPTSTVDHDGTVAATTNVPDATVKISQPTDLQAEAQVSAPVNLPFGGMFGFGSGVATAQAVAQVNTAVANVNGEVLDTYCSNEPCTYMANSVIPTELQTTGWEVTSNAEEPTTNHYSGETSVNIQTCEGHQGNGQCYAPDTTTAATTNPWVVDLNGESEGGMWQTVPTTVGARYVLNFELTGNPALNGWPSGSSNYFPLDVYVTDGSDTQYTPSVNEGSTPSSPCSSNQPSSGFIACGWWDYQDPVCNGSTAVVPSDPTNPANPANPAVTPAGLTLNNCTTSGQEEAYFSEESLSFVAKSNETTITFNSEVYDNNAADGGDYWFYCGPEVANITLGYPEIQLAQ